MIKETGLVRANSVTFCMPIAKHAFADSSRFYDIINRHGIKGTMLHKSIILLRAPVDLSLGSNARNKTVASIMKACITYDYFRPEAKNMGVLYWHGLCAVLMTTITYVYEL